MKFKNTVFFGIICLINFISVGQLQMTDIYNVMGPTQNHLEGNEKIIAKHIDGLGNLFLATYDNHVGYCGNYSECFAYNLSKFGPTRELIWEQDFYDYQIGDKRDFYACLINGITTDEIGNIYISGSYGCEGECFFGNYSVEHIGFDNFLHSFTAKLDSETGEFLWVMNNINEISDRTVCTDIKYYDNKLFVSYSQSDPGQIMRINGRDHVDFQLDGDFGIFSLDTSGALLSINYGQGIISSWINASTFDSYGRGVITVAPKMLINPSGEIHLLGEGSPSLEGGAFAPKCNISCPHDGANFFCATLNPTMNEWVGLRNVWRGYKEPYIVAAVDDFGQVYQAFGHRWDGYVGGNTLIKSCFPSSNEKFRYETFLVKYDPKKCQDTWLKKIEGSAITVSSLQKHDHEIYLAGSLGGAIRVENQDFEQLSIGNRDPFLMQIDTGGIVLNNWMFGSNGRDKVIGTISTSENLHVIGYSEDMPMNDGSLLSEDIEFTYDLQLGRGVVLESELLADKNHSFLILRTEKNWFKVNYSGFPILDVQLHSIDGRTIEVSKDFLSENYVNCTSNLSGVFILSIIGQSERSTSKFFLFGE